jgi:hypothetical protein
MDDFLLSDDIKLKHMISFDVNDIHPKQLISTELVSRHS